ncbi:WapI family immunity protein [Acidaminobacterium chupaoyuni]
MDIQCKISCESKELKLLSFCYFQEMEKDPYNSDLSFYLAVKHGFWSGCAMIYTKRAEFTQFAKQLSDLYESLSGQAELYDIELAETVVSFHAQKRGYIKISGTLQNGFDPESGEQLRFGFTIDQSEMKGFISQVNAAAAAFDGLYEQKKRSKKPWKEMCSDGNIPF